MSIIYLVGILVNIKFFIPFQAYCPQKKEPPPTLPTPIDKPPRVHVRTRIMRTQDLLDELAETLQSNHGDFFAACRTCRVSPSFVRKWAKDDAKVKEILDEAEAVGSLSLESEALRRAVDGVDEGVYYRGELVGTEKKYSDTLLNTLLKAKIRDKYAQEGGTNVNVAITNEIQAFPRPNSYSEWLQLVDQTNALPPPSVEEPVEAEFTTVLPPPELDPNMQDIL